MHFFFRRVEEFTFRISKISRLNYYSERSRAIRRGLENIYVSKQDSGGVPLPVSNKARSKREEEQSDAKERKRKRDCPSFLELSSVEILRIYHLTSG